VHRAGVVIHVVGFAGPALLAARGDEAHCRDSGDESDNFTFHFCSPEIVLGCRADHLQRFEVAQSAAQDEFRTTSDIARTQRGRTSSGPPATSGARRARHGKKRRGPIPSWRARFQAPTRCANHFVTEQQRLAPGGVNLHGEVVNLFAEGKLVVGGVQFGRLESGLVALEVGAIFLHVEQRQAES